MNSKEKEEEAERKEPEIQEHKQVALRSPIGTLKTTLHDTLKRQLVTP